MSMNLRFPNITGVTEAEQLTQIKSYLHQLVQQLNWALSNLEPSTASESNAGTKSPMEGFSEETFNELKALLIQSSSTLNSYYEKINARLESHYLKQADFEAYKQEVTQAIGDLDNRFVQKAALDAHKQEVSGILSGFAGAYVSKTAFDAYTLANDQTIAGLQQDIIALRQMIEGTNNTGGE